MRRREREITDEAAIRDILDKAGVLHLGLSDDGQPYVVPMNYGYRLEKGKLTLYLHGAREGYKYEVLAKIRACRLRRSVIPHPCGQGGMPVRHGLPEYYGKGHGTAH